MSESRTYLLKRIWTSARNLKHGEALVRRNVSALNDRDGTNLEVRGTADYESTRRLSGRQLRILAERMIDAAGDPPLRRVRRRKLPDNVIRLAGDDELEYSRRLAAHLGMSDEALSKFVRRQVKRPQIRTRADAQKVIPALEAMLRRDGWTMCRKPYNYKHWHPPAAAEAS